MPGSPHPSYAAGQKLSGLCDLFAVCGSQAKSPAILSAIDDQTIRSAVGVPNGLAETDLPRLAKAALVASGAAAVALASADVVADVAADVANVSAGPAIAGTATATPAAGPASEDGLKISVPPAPTVRLVPAGIAHALVAMSVPAETVVPPV